MSSVSSSASRANASGRTLVLAALAISGVIAVVGCDKQSPKIAPALDVMRPEVDRTTGAIELPLDHYGISFEEERTLEFAAELSLRRCAQQEGVRYRAIDRRAEDPPPSRLYGVWHMPSARQFGYSRIDTRLSARFQQQKMRQWSERESRVLESCTIGIGALTVPRPLLSEQAAFAFGGQALKTPEALAALDDWAGCLQKAGLPRPSSSEPLRPRNVEGASIAIAIADVRCKRRTDLVERLAMTEAEVQARWMTEHLFELRIQRQSIRSAVATAQSIIERR